MSIEFNPRQTVGRLHLRQQIAAAGSSGIQGKKDEKVGPSINNVYNAMGE